MWKGETNAPTWTLCRDASCSWIIHLFIFYVYPRSVPVSAGKPGTIWNFSPNSKKEHINQPKGQTYKSMVMTLIGLTKTRTLERENTSSTVMVWDRQSRTNPSRAIDQAYTPQGTSAVNINSVSVNKEKIELQYEAYSGTSQMDQRTPFQILGIFQANTNH